MISETDIFLNVNDFAQAVTYAPPGGAGSSINVLKHEAGTTLNIGGEEFITSEITYEAKTSDLSGIAQNATITDSGVTYYVVDHRKKNDAFTLLIISKTQV